MHTTPVDRGRLARTPSEVPARGWKDVLLRIYGRLSSDRIVLIAAGISFYSILALFPAIAAMVALYGLFADPSSIAAQLDNFSGVLPEGAIDVIKQEIGRVAAQGNNTLGFTFIAGLAVSITGEDLFRCDKFADFISRCPVPAPGSYLADAVKGFFANGGRTCWVAAAAPR